MQPITISRGMAIIYLVWLVHVQYITGWLEKQGEDPNDYCGSHPHHAYENSLCSTLSVNKAKSF